MSGYMKIKLCKGRRVRNPFGGEILDEKEVYKVPLSQFWLRRLECGDVEVLKEVKEKKVSKKKSKKEKIGE